MGENVKHATIKLGDYTIPLIGVDRTATLEECDLCHDIFSIQAVWLTGTQILCEKCYVESAECIVGMAGLKE